MPELAFVPDFPEDEFVQRLVRAQRAMAAENLGASAGHHRGGVALFFGVSHAVLAKPDAPLVPDRASARQADCDHSRDWRRTHARDMVG